MCRVCLKEFSFHKHCYSAIEYGILGSTVSTILLALTLKATYGTHNLCHSKLKFIVGVLHSNMALVNLSSVAYNFVAYKINMIKYIIK